MEKVFNSRDAVILILTDDYTGYQEFIICENYEKANALSERLVKNAERLWYLEDKIELTKDEEIEYNNLKDKVWLSGMAISRNVFFDNDHNR